jgi:hypothetical protein
MQVDPLQYALAEQLESAAHVARQVLAVASHE